MKLTSVVFCLFCAISLQAQDDFSYRRKINDVSEEGWYSITIPAEQFRNMKDQLQDLRIYSIDTDTTEIPYIIETLKNEITTLQVDLKATNRSKRDGKLFITFETGGQSVNALVLKFHEPNYFASVKLEGSDNRREWFELVKDQRIFHIANQVEDYGSGMIRFPMTNYRYLRAEITSDTTISFASATFERTVIKEGNFQLIPSSFTTRQDKATKQTIVDIKLDHFRPVSLLELDIDTTEDYYRSMQIQYLVDSTKTEKGWVKNHEGIYDGYLTSFDSRPIDLGLYMAQGLRVIINNYDNSPLKIKDVKVSGATIQVKAKLKEANSYLYYGHVSLNKPKYDLKYFKGKIPTEIPSASLAAEENISHIPKPSSPLFVNKNWLWIIMGAIILLLGFFTVRMMRSKEVG